ncbi:uncharacterized protein L969DRAFT_49782 [Mixia osmundae IAM 14324]|uniref:Ubiquitin carboxyl-terminal hydrolase n=1 Tax=Mixia osmundae (strain CBS 9802 / IAM 14324 / JCM 22182 / KY 12970) TaxID=764103 RepID=G7DYY9_MIXOS|nr:uncharacterized protein L969DRAFT_49782 [Mixia osmundae IAM 14324]KEI38630.1 hypothetical protein L969DRAFT_49782 [Mixia osmundae IAM 14324]GAA95799.1 hypothetical protein E5Q_02456 [Mixia osmundae IAM 14324]
MNVLRWMNVSKDAGSAAQDEHESKREWWETTGETYFGMENFGNTCYANSVLQALYFCKPFRELLIQFARLEQYQVQLKQRPQETLNVTSQLDAESSDPSRARTLTNDADVAFSEASFGKRSQSSASVVDRERLAELERQRKAALARPGTSSGRSALSAAFARKSSASGTDLAKQSSSGTPRPSTAPSFASLSTAAQSAHATASTPASPTKPSGSSLNVPLTSQALQNVAASDQKVLQAPTLYTALRDLFVAISSQPKALGTVAPQAFITQLKRENELFRSTMHQDAHEFLNYLINTVSEDVEERAKGFTRPDGELANRSSTFIHSLFAGLLTNETRCLTCETVTSRDEAFLDLSIDIEQNSSISACLRQFSASEMLCSRNKFSCDHCGSLQEAEKRMKVKELPNVLALHLKRFKYQENLGRHVKLGYRVVFPLELRLFNTADDAKDADRLYELFAIVVHIGIGPHHGHYVTVLRTGSRWLLFDDDSVTLVNEAEIQTFFGGGTASGGAYVLFYQAAELDVHALAVSTFGEELVNAVDNAQQPRKDIVFDIGAASLSSTPSLPTQPNEPELTPAIVPAIAPDTPLPDPSRDLRGRDRSASGVLLPSTVSNSNSAVGSRNWISSLRGKRSESEEKQSKTSSSPETNLLGTDTSPKTYPSGSSPAASTSSIALSETSSKSTKASNGPKRLSKLMRSGSTTPQQHSTPQALPSELSMTAAPRSASTASAVKMPRDEKEAKRAEKDEQKKRKVELKAKQKQLDKELKSTKKLGLGFFKS